MRKSLLLLRKYTFENYVFFFSSKPSIELLYGHISVTNEDLVHLPCPDLCLLQQLRGLCTLRVQECGANTRGVSLNEQTKGLRAELPCSLLQPVMHGLATALKQVST